MKKRIVGPVIAVAWLGSLYLAYGLGGMAGMFMPDRVSTAARTAFAVMTLLPASSAGACADDPASCGFADTEGRVEVDCDAFVGDGPDQAVLFVFGQSNSANAARDRYVTGHEAINFNPHDGKWYQTQDPLLGPDGRGGSVWGRLGDGLVREGLYRRVLIVPIGIGGTQLEEKQLRRMLGKHKIAAVPHGFRSSFRDWAAEETDHPREVIEAALAHGTFVTDYRGIPAGQDAPAVVVTAYRPDPTRWDET